MTKGEELRIRVEEVLRGLEDVHGRVTPEIVVEAARDPEHPLHNRFEWDDNRAAHSHRVATARRLIASVQLRVKSHKVILSAPAYVRDPRAEPGAQGYRSVVSLRDDAEDAREAIVAEMVRVRSILSRTRALVLALGREADLDALDAAVEAFVASLDHAGPLASA